MSVWAEIRVRDEQFRLVADFTWLTGLSLLLLSSSTSDFCSTTYYSKSIMTDAIAIAADLPFRSQVSASRKFW